MLRHAQISTTAAYYTDKKRVITAGLGAFLTPDKDQMGLIFSVVSGGQKRTFL